ncbi:MAG TPA: phosphatidylglycerophosphatase A [Alphaproteobacteria bacterium]|nr:phosphatidylglycerophosphatase A [Alphaproteobacteria bacterium]
MILSPLPPGIGPVHPAVLIATGLGSGRLPGWPGTWGSLAALPLAWLLQGWLGPVGLAGAALLAFLVGCWASGVYVAAGPDSDPDPSPVVIDEVAGQWLTLVVAPREIAWYALGFALFRLFDILKPWPISWLERRVPGALGIMIDDVAAAVFAMAILALAVNWV